MPTRNPLTSLSLFVLPLALGLALAPSAWAAGPSVTASAASDATPAAQLAAAARASGAGTLPQHDLQLFAEVLQRVRENYVGPVDEHKLMQAAIRGMVESLDAHSTFLSDDEFQDMQVTTSGAYAGIGVEVAAAKDGVSITHRMPGSPAEHAGLRAGDTIVSIDGVAVDPANVNAAIDRMRGAEGSTIHLVVRRAGAPSPLQFAIRRAEVRLVSVEAERLQPDYGYLRITSFTDSTADELEDAVAHLEHGAPHPLKGFVIDLRNNPGGVLDSAIRVADDFLNSGTIVSARGRTDEANFRVNATPGDITHGAHLIVVVNGGSASAAEVLAAALHDNGRATLVGRRTYGKGTVQTIMPMPYGTALKITTSRYYTPAGVCINGIGIVPDVVLKGPEQLPADLDDPDDAQPLTARRAADPIGAATAATPGAAASAVSMTAGMPIPTVAANASAAAAAPATAGPSASATLAERDPQVGLALSLLRGEHPSGVASSAGSRERVISRLDAGGTVR
jgi:carboxyl-terminal processing protease